MNILHFNSFSFYFAAKNPFIILKNLIYLFVFVLLVGFQAKGNNIVYPGTKLLHLDSIGNMAFKKNCPEEKFNSLIYDFNYTIFRSLLPLEDARAYLKFLREVIIIRPEFEKYSYSIDLAQASLYLMCKDYQNFVKFDNSVQEKLIKKGKFTGLLEYQVGLGNFFNFNSNQDSATQRYRMAEGIINQIGFTNLETKAKDISIQNANALAIGFRENNVLDSAKFYFNLGLLRAQLTQRVDWQGIISGNLAAFQISNGNTESAEELLLQDYQQSIKTGQTGSAINALLSLVDLHILNQKYSKANQIYDTAALLIKRVEPTYNEEINIFKSGLRLRAIKLGLVSGQNTAALFYLDSLYAALRKEKSKEILSDRYVIEDSFSKIVSLKEERKRNTIIAGAITILMILAIILAFLQRRYNSALSEKNAKIKKQSKKLENLNQQKSKLFSVVAHDIRGPIGTLNSLIELYSEKEISEKELIEYSKRIGDNLNSLNAMLDNLLIWAKSGMENGIVPKFSKIDLEDLCQEITKQIKPQLSKKNISLNFIHSEQIWVQTDPALLTVIVRNLLTNAIKFSEPNSSIDLVLTPNKDINKIDISVVDQGKGIDEKSLTELLQSNTGVASKPGTQGELGTGLGLVLCKEFTAALNGTFSGKSTLDKGTSFTVSLPMDL
ncbi:MAG: HAMP domain-containing histidine kinase [Bacteroidia bacterium]|nr:HAMP domain-containing histidine kinase [Bacteroidia bacterium]